MPSTPQQTTSSQQQGIVAAHATSSSNLATGTKIAPSGRSSFPSATKTSSSTADAFEPSNMSAAVGGATPAHNHSESMNSRNPTIPAIPSVNGNSTFGSDHTRKPSMTVTLNGGAVGGVQSKPTNIQFGAMGAPGTPSMGTPTLAHQNPASLGVNQLNPRMTSPSNSPSPIPQPASVSGGRPPSTFQGQGNGLVFGQSGGDSSDPTGLARPMSQMQFGPAQQDHMRRGSSQSIHSDMGNSSLPTGPGGRGYNMQGGRGRGGYGNSQYQAQMSYSPHQNFRPTPAGRGMNPNYQGRGQQGPYQNSPAMGTRSPAMMNATPNTPQMNHMQMMPGMQGQQPNGYYMGPHQGFPTTVDPSIQMMYNQQYFGTSQQMQGQYPNYIPPQSPRPTFQQGGYGAPHMQSTYSNQGQPPPSMSRQSSQMSMPDRPASSVGQQPHTPAMSTPAAPSHASARTPSISTQKSADYRVPAKKSAALLIKNAAGEVVNFGKPPASPATTAPVSVTTPAPSAPTPPSRTGSAVDNAHTRTDSVSVKSEEEKKRAMQEAVKAKIAAEKQEREQAEQKVQMDKEAAELAEREAVEAKEKAEALEKEAKEAEERKAAKADADKAAAAKAEADKIEADKAAAAKAEADKAEADKLEAEKAEAEKAEAEKAEAEKAEAEKAEAEKAKAEKVETEKAEAEKVETEKAEAAKAESAKAEADAAAAKAEETSKAESAAPTASSNDDEIDYDAIEAEYAAIEAEEARKEEEYAKKKAAQKEAQRKKEQEEELAYETNMKELERQAEAREEAREKEKENADTASGDEGAKKMFAELKSNAAMTPTSTDSPAAATPAESGTATPMSDASMPPPARGMAPGKRGKATELTLDTKKPVEPPEPSATLKSLQSARKVEDLSKISYPAEIASPNPALNANAPADRKFKYDKEFLLQFQPVFKEKPSLDWDARLREALGDGDSSARASASARTPSGMGGRSASNRPAPAATAFGPMGAFGGVKPALPPGTTSEQRFAASNAAMRGPSGPPVAANPFAQFGRGQMGPMARSPSNNPLGPIPGSPRVGGGASRGGSRAESKRNNKHGGGRGDEKAMPLTAGMDLAPIAVTSTGWKPRSVGQQQVGPALGGEGLMEPDVVQRKVKAALNKMTPEKFDKIADQILEIAAQSKHESDGRTLRQVIQLTFEKATDEAHWAPMYAMFARKMLESMSPDIKDENIKDKNGAIVTGGNLFRKYLLNRCQEEFERGWKVNLPAPKEGETVEAAILSDEYYVAAAAKRRGLGLVRFIGELFKLGMLTERIMHECVKKLVDYDGVPDEAEIESLTGLLRTIGKQLDDPESRGQGRMNVYFERINAIIVLPELPSRLRFMLMDIVDLRSKGWNSKEDDKGPKTIQQIREDAEAKAREAELQRMAQQNNRGGGGRMPVGRGDARNFSGYGQMPPPDNSNRVGTDDLRRLGNRNSRNPSSAAGPGSLGPPSMLGARTNSGRRGLGPGSLLARGGEDSNASSRTGTPPAQKEKEKKDDSSTNAFSALAALEQADGPASPPSNPASPPTQKSQPNIERERSRSPEKSAE